MPFVEIKKNNGARIGIWQITETEDQLLSLLREPAQYQKELDAYVSAKRRIEFLAVRVMLQQLTGEVLCVGYEPSGKPFLINHTELVSISHTGGYAAVILHPSLPVAIDIEQRSEKVLRLQSKFMNAAELAAVDPSSPLSYALLCWSAKETLFKIIPEEEIDFKSHLHLSPFLVASQGTIPAMDTRNDLPRHFTINYADQQDYVLTWCVREGENTL
ncbi:MAG: siderophore biosynthesis protein [Bacteroidales bacterium]